MFHLHRCCKWLHSNWSRHRSVWGSLWFLMLEDRGTHELIDVSCVKTLHTYLYFRTAKRFVIITANTMSELWRGSLQSFFISSSFVYTFTMSQRPSGIICTPDELTFSLANPTVLYCLTRGDSLGLMVSHFLSAFWTLVLNTRITDRNLGMLFVINCPLLRLYRYFGVWLFHWDDRLIQDVFPCLAEYLLDLLQAREAKERTQVIPSSNGFVDCALATCKGNWHYPLTSRSFHCLLQTLYKQLGGL